MLGGFPAWSPELVLRELAKILLVEVRSFPDYYNSEPYMLVKKYSNILKSIIEEGVVNGEIRGDISPSIMMQVILGALENICLSAVIFDREISPDDLSEYLCELLFRGIKKNSGIHGTA